jgi:hypothetical protein
MLLHLILYCVYFLKIQKAIQNWFENLLWEIRKEKEKENHFLSVFGPPAPLGLLPLRPVSLFLLPRPAPSLGRAQLRPPAQNRASAPLFSVPVTDFAGPRVGRAFFLKPPASGVSKNSTDRILNVIFLFPSLGPPPGYKNGTAAPSASHRPTYRSFQSSRGGHARSAALDARLSEPHALLDSSSASVLP